MAADKVASNKVKKVKKERKNTESGKKDEEQFKKGVTRKNNGQNGRKRAKQTPAYVTFGSVLPNLSKKATVP